ncbi:hypothetical protein J2S74_001526 [Evansella vedderi]|uniref:Uncharacterized protein n=1 Tax=Evansella vedderi TaxID=38282 RepID=A0ABT9ZUM1_9BACI|nr:hypothetical protein [Evansella vedderi]MDQ0254153.1 hypothetical protein [Evansella vedderi]
MEENFETYYRRRVKEEQEILKGLGYSEGQLREIYKQEYEYKQSRPKLELQLEPQLVNYALVQGYLPEKWEMLRDGKLLGSDDELVDVLNLIIYNLGIRKSFDSIPRKLIEEYVEEPSKEGRARVGLHKKETEPVDVELKKLDKMTKEVCEEDIDMIDMPLDRTGRIIKELELMLTGDFFSNELAEKIADLVQCVKNNKINLFDYRRSYSREKYGKDIIDAIAKADTRQKQKGNKHKT